MAARHLLPHSVRSTEYKGGAIVMFIRGAKEDWLRYLSARQSVVLVVNITDRWVG